VVTIAGVARAVNLEFDCLNGLWFAMRRGLGGVGLCSALMLGAACSPRFDWREYRAPEGLQALFPARIQTASRPIDLAGLHLRMRMDAARVGELSFVVGVTSLPDGAAASRGAVEDAIEAALLRNIGASAPAMRKPALIGAAAGRPGVTGVALQSEGTTGRGPVRITARIFSSGSRVYEVMVAGPSSVMDEAETREAIDTFMTSLRLP
jgi:hypothetical protein